MSFVATSLLSLCLIPTQPPANKVPPEGIYSFGCHLVAVRHSDVLVWDTAKRFNSITVNLELTRETKLTFADLVERGKGDNQLVQKAIRAADLKKDQSINATVYWDGKTAVLLNGTVPGPNLSGEWVLP